MGDWRERAKGGEWHHIIEGLLSNAEHEELLGILKEIVPKRLFGDGIETYLDHILPGEAKTPEINSAAQLLQQMLRYPRREFSHADQLLVSPFKDARQVAYGVLRAHNVVFEGWRNTYFYWHPKRKQFVQVRRKRAELIIANRSKLQERQSAAIGDFKEFRKLLRLERTWMNTYPWRRCHSLSYLWRFDEFESFTPLWHALNIISCHSGFRDEFHEETRWAQHDVSRKDYARNLLRAVETGMEIGRSYEALKRKKYEVEAIKHMERREYGAHGGKERGKLYEADRQKLMSDIQEQLDDGKNTSTALRMVVAKNLKVRVFIPTSQTHKTEFSRIRGVWYRHRKKL